MINVPQALAPLADTPLWVCFPLVENKKKHGGAGGYDKPPFNVHTLRIAHIDNPQDLGTWEEAAACVGKTVNAPDKEHGGYVSVPVSGAGLVLKGSGLFCLDLDEVRNKETGELTPEAGEIVRLLSPVAYIEVSVSGKGLHCLMFGSVPEGIGGGRYPGRPDALGGSAAEYQFLINGYATVTGEALPGCASELSDPSGPLGEVCRRFFSVDSAQALEAPQVSGAVPGMGRPQAAADPSRLEMWQERSALMTDYDFMHAVYQSGSYGEHVRRLYNGDWSFINGTYKGARDDSQSVGDWALGKALLEFAQDWGRAESLFRGSKLYRDEKTLSYLFKRLRDKGMPSPAVGHIDFTPEDKRRYHIANDEPLAWPEEPAAPQGGAAAQAPEGSPSVGSANVPNGAAAAASVRSIPQTEEPDPALLLGGDMPVFIAGSHADARALLSCGVPALALQGLGGDKLLGLVNNARPHVPLILALGQSPQGEKGARLLSDKLRTVPGVKWIKAPAALYGGYPDIAQAYAHIPDFASAASGASRGAVETLEEQEKKDLADYYQEQADYEKEHADAVRDMTPRIQTGITALDNALGGGLLPQYYVLGAISSLGKSTLCGQICDNIALTEGGRDVIIFTLEMSRDDLLCKSFARMMAERRAACLPDDVSGPDLAHALEGLPSASDIGEGWKRFSLPKEIQQEIERTEAEYFERTRGRIWIISGRQDVNSIREQIFRHVDLSQRAHPHGWQPPVVLVDYIQILAAPEDAKFYSDKAKLDNDVYWLGETTRTKGCHMPIIGISSFNRANYYAPADLNALNGSGNLEYDADYVIAAQYYAVNLVNEKGETTFKVKTERRRPAREIELSIVKGRKAETGGSVRLFYCPRNDFFRTAGDGTVFECEKEQGFRDNTKDLEKMNQALFESLSDTQHPASWDDIDPRVVPCGDVERFCRLAAYYQKHEGTIPGATRRSGSSSVDSASTADGFGERRRGSRKGRNKNQAMAFDDAINQEKK